MDWVEKGVGQCTLSAVTCSKPCLVFKCVPTAWNPCPAERNPSSYKRDKLYSQFSKAHSWAAEFVEATSLSVAREKPGQTLHLFLCSVSLPQNSEGLWWCCSNPLSCWCPRFVPTVFASQLWGWQLRQRGSSWDAWLVLLVYGCNGSPLALPRLSFQCHFNKWKKILGRRSPSRIWVWVGVCN